MTIYDYCAHKNPQGTAKVIASYGMRPVRTNARDLSSQIKYCAKQHGGDVLKKLILVHPDRELFEFERQLLVAKEKEKEMSGASGCGCSNASGDESKQSADVEIKRLQESREKSESDSKLLSQNNLIIGGVIVLGLALIMKK